MVQIATAQRRPAASPAADARRREILAAASAAFRRKGLAATGMREIAAETGMTAGNLYYYFRSKQELLAFCQETTVDALLAEAQSIAAEELGAAEKLRRAIVAHVVCLNETYPGSLAHLEIEALEPGRREPLARRRKQYERVIANFVAAGVASGELVPRDPGLVARALLGALNWTVKWFSAEGEKSASEVGGELAALFLDGLARRAA